jgi:hypothetical protein
MPHTGDEPFEMMAARSDSGVTFLCVFFSPWNTHRIFTVDFNEIPEDYSKTFDYFLRLIEADMGPGNNEEEQWALSCLADEMAEAADIMS